ncbi:MAG TPA: glucose-6-phosphate dehydrogenase assembly protein OpcA [Thermoleophilaceae bacterium]|nr:glucose-6-phosphate dehydrogenase assembly protein OpcA [Thermoleophilaceae bacterium]
MSGSVWAAQDTTPAQIETGLRDLLRERHARSEAYVPARVLNLVVVADREWRGEIQNRLDQVGRYHASRTILCCVEPGQDTIDAWATAEGERASSPTDVSILHEQVVLDIGSKHLEHLETIVDPLVVTDLPTLVWSPHGHPEAVDAMLDLAQIVLIDSVHEPDPAGALRRAQQLSERAYVVDLAWLRSTPWRERVAFAFDPMQWRGELWKISSVTVKHRPDSRAAGLLFLGWLAKRLGWEPGSMLSQNGALHGIAHARRQDVKLRLEPDETINAPGLAGVAIETASGLSASLDRGSGGLTARRRLRDGLEREWTVMGASRGEAGILGEGIRQAMLRDKTYGPALSAAQAMLG